MGWRNLQYRYQTSLEGSILEWQQQENTGFSDLPLAGLPRFSAVGGVCEKRGQASFTLCLLAIEELCVLDGLPSLLLSHCQQPQL